MQSDQAVGTMSLNCGLESNRISELETILPLVQSKIIDFVRNAEPIEGRLPGTIGPLFESPDALKDVLNLDRFDYTKGEAKDLNVVLEVIQSILDNSINTWHSGFLDKLYAATNPIGVVSDILLSVLNTNSHVFTVSPALTLIEKFISTEYAKKFGYKGEFAGGLTFPGGSWSNVTSLQLARSILFPDTKLEGSNRKFAVYSSLHSHYSVEKACILLGMGKNSLFKVKVNDLGEMDISDLSSEIEKSIAKGYTPLYINATAGTTVFGSFDNFTDISHVAKKFNIWFHIDGSWGGNVCFSESQKQKLKGSDLADSITANPHKMLGVPTTCSFLLLPDKRLFQQANSLDAPYLFHNALEGEENYDLGDGTMGCGRRADSLKFYLSWLYYGDEGFARRVDHAFSIATYFADKISTIPAFKLVSQTPLPCLQVCFYFNPLYENGVAVSKEQNTEMTRFIAKQLYKSGKFLVDYSPNSDPTKDEGEFFRVVFNSPNVNDAVVDELIESVIKMGKSLPQ